MGQSPGEEMFLFFYDASHNLDALWLSNLKFISLSSFVSWSLAFVSDSGNDFQTLICHFYFYHYFCLEDVQKKNTNRINFERLLSSKLYQMTKINKPMTILLLNTP